MAIAAISGKNVTGVETIHRACRLPALGAQHNDVSGFSVRECIHVFGDISITQPAPRGGYHHGAISRNGRKLIYSRTDIQDRS